MAATLPATLRSVTKTKIVELKKQRDLYESSRAEIERSIIPHDKQLEQTESLLKGCFRIEGVRIPDENSDDDSDDGSDPPHAQKLNNYRKLLKQARLDPSFPPAALDRIQQTLNKELELKSLQHQHAQFYSELVTEWVSDTNDSATEFSTVGSEGAMSASASGFENVGRKEMHDQRKEWESIVFSDAEVDTKAISAYLEKLFKAKPETRKAFEAMKRNILTFCHELETKELFTSDSVKLAIKTLLATDLLSEDKRATLKTFSTNKEVLKEVSDVLQMRFSSLETWQWTMTSKDAILLEQRRQLNGKYRVYMDEDVLDALFVHQIGMEWAKFLKDRFNSFLRSFAWNRTANTVPLEARQRREWFLGKDEEGGTTVTSCRYEAYLVKYFMTQLPDSLTAGPKVYDGSDAENEPDSDPNNTVTTKHQLLHLLITEALLARHLYPNQPYSIIRSDYKWFGPSLPHPTIFTVLKFFGVNDTWCAFIHKFLQTPVRFLQDGPNGAMRVRKRGIAMSHVLSDVLSETVMFVSDFAINQATMRNQYRMHDDFWFWGPSDICRTAWQEMRTFAFIMGLEFNQQKTGSVTFPPCSGDSNDERDKDDDSDVVDIDVDDDEQQASSSSIHPDPYSVGLPTGEVRWGFLNLHRETVRFEVDRKMVDEHIKELKLQLDSCKSIFAWVQAYNSYASRFFTNNLCSPCYAFGRQHIDAMIDTFNYIQKSLFPATGRVTDHLASMASSRFGLSASTTAIPEGFWYMPISLGGLELRNPVIPLLGMRESMRCSTSTPSRILKKALDKDESKYLNHKQTYEKKNTGRGLGPTKSSAKKRAAGISDNYDDDNNKNNDNDNKNRQEFMPTDEYLRYREERSHALAIAYSRLQTVPEKQSIDLTPEIEALFDTVKSASRKKTRRGGAAQGLDSDDPYWSWIVAVYGPEIVERYGSLQMVDPGQVPLGIVGVMKAGKIRWRG